MANMGSADVLDRSKLWTDAEVDAAARKWSEESVKERGSASQHEALAEWRADILNSDILAQNKRIELLGNALMKISMFNIFQVAERIEVYDLAQSKLLSIPGHAKYFTDKIDEARRSDEERIKSVEFTPDWEKYPQDSEIYQSNGWKWFYLWANYANACSENIGILSHIPSTESVRALGNYLRERNEPNIKCPPPDTGRLAAEGLMRLISDGPILSSTAGSEEVGKWRRWFDEVRAGTRTFRFVGSDVNYTLDGPADARTLERINRTRKQEKTEAVRERAAAQGSSGKAVHDSSKPGNSVAIIASLVLVLGSLVWYRFRMGRRWQRQKNPDNL